MDKPKRFIHMERRGGSVLMVGRKAVPMDVFGMLILFATLGAAGWGIARLIMGSYAPEVCEAPYADGTCPVYLDFSGFIYLGWIALAFLAFYLIWAVINFIAWTVRRFKFVNGREWENG